MCTIVNEGEIPDLFKYAVDECIQMLKETGCLNGFIM